MKLIGRLSYWNDQKLFGFIESRTPDRIGFRVQKYFLHSSEIQIEPELIQVGQFVRFIIKSKQPRSGPLPFAGEVEVYENMEQLQAAEKGGEGRAL
jgi:hypothetical protein